MSGAAASTEAVDFVFMFIVAISAFFVLLITFLMIFFVIKYNKKRHTKAKDIPGNTALEITWTVIPTILVLFMFYFGWKGFEFIRNAPKDSMQIKVTARMWSWMFEYENGFRTDTLLVPNDKPVNLQLHSLDVIHSFYVPAFRIKEDVVPGLNNHLWFKAEQPGAYDVLCAEYCGSKHAYMRTKIKVLPQDEYDDWYANVAEPAAKALAAKDTTKKAAAAAKPVTTPAASTQQGKKLFSVYGCAACHSTDGSKLVGPTLKGIFGSQVTVVTADGKEIQVKATEDYLRESILKPKAKVVKGFIPVMPAQGDRITDAELNALIEYLKEL
jgi:cytochrome c oxidase subunit 2